MIIRIRTKAIFAASLIVAALIFSTVNTNTANADDTRAPSSSVSEITAVKAVLAAYNTATARLDLSGTETLFASDSEVIETGAIEGTYSYYLEHHIGPELKEFKTFEFKNYAVNVTLDQTYAFATESFEFRIEPKSGEAAVERLGVATSVLKMTAKGWKIFRYHWSSRRPPAKPSPSKP